MRADQEESFMFLAYDGLGRFAKEVADLWH